MPLLNLNEGYGPSYPGMNSVIQAMLHVTGRVNIDPQRVYLLSPSAACPSRPPGLAPAPVPQPRTRREGVRSWTRGQCSVL